MSETAFDVTLDDGRVAHCWQAICQPYADCVVSAGLVEGIEPDTLYFIRCIVFLVVVAVVVAVVVYLHDARPEVWLDECVDACAGTYGAETAYYIQCAALCQSYYYEELVE